MQRILAIDGLAADSGTLAGILASDPSPQVRAAAAKRCADRNALISALRTDTDTDVRAAVVEALVGAAQGSDGAGVAGLLADAELPDAARAEIARLASDSEVRRTMIASITDESVLVELASVAANSETRVAAAERVQSADALRRLADGAANRDHGVYRLVKQRLEAIKNRQSQTSEADAILAQLEALVLKPGPILSELVDLDRRWQALDMRADAARLARCDAARRLVQERLDREQEEYRSRTRLEARLREWAETLAARASGEPIAVLRSELAALRDECQAGQIKSADTLLDEVEQRLNKLDAERQVLAGAEALVIEAEQLAAGTYIDDAKLPERWQALERAIRTPELTRRFETAMTIVEQRRLAHVKAAQEEVNAVRARVHALLHSAEVALAAGQLKETRAAADELKAMRSLAGTLPKPTIQRLSRLSQQLVELERWQSFGQQTARVQLCERAEALPAQASDPRQLAQEVQKLREEWKALDQQYAGVPKALWERFDRGCEAAYAPAAKHFAELAAQRKQSRKQREDFIDAAAAHAPTLLTDPRDWRAIERWLRETDNAWREKDLGSVEPRLWKKLDTRLKTALAPLRDELTRARDDAKAAREQLIAEAVTLGGQANDREAPAKVKALQARWQEHAKSVSLLQRDERALWEQFRAACDAVFSARNNKRKEVEDRKQSHRREYEEICVRLEQLANTRDEDDATVRSRLRELSESWRRQADHADPAYRSLEGRFRGARANVETLLTARARSRETAVWDTLASKERMCEALDQLVRSGGSPEESGIRAEAIKAEWSAAAAMPAAWEQKVLARRDAAIRALADPAAASAYVAVIERGAPARREALLELELLLGLESPGELQAERLALQVKQLRDRFKNAATPGADTAAERLREWCAAPGIVEGRDRERRDRVFAAIKRKR